MKTTQKGFIAPLILIIIAIVILGGGAYVYTQQEQANPLATENVTLPKATSTAFESGEVMKTPSQDVSNTPITLTTGDICSPLYKDTSMLLFTDDNKKIWTVNYQDARFSEYSFSTGKVQGTDGLLKTTLQDWLKSLYRVGQPQAEFCGAPGKITITGTLIGNTVFASRIELRGQ
jgi:hypothetical protein